MSPTYGVATLLLASLCWSASASAQSDDGGMRWVFERSRLEGPRFTPTDGPLGARLEKRAVFAEDRALVLDGKTLLEVSNDLPAVAFPRGAITVEARVLLRKPLDWGGLVGAFQDNGDYERGFVLGFRGDRFSFGLATTGSGRLTYITGGPSITDGEWHHVAGVYDGERASLWVDGQLAARSEPLRGDILHAPKGEFVIASYKDDNEDNRADGLLREVAVLPRALDAETIARRAAIDDELPAPPREVFGPFSVLIGPFAKLVAPGVASFEWETETPASMRLEIGPPDGPFASHAATEGAAATLHRVVVEGLERERVHHYRLRGVAEDGEELVTALYELDTSFDYSRASLPERPWPWPEDAAIAALADRIVAAATGRRGYCVVLDAGDCRLAAELARRTEWRIVALEPDAERVARARRALDAAALHGHRVSVRRSTLADAALSPLLANVVVSEGALLEGRAACDPREAARLVRPEGGILVLGASSRDEDTPLDGDEIAALDGGEIAALDGEGPALRVWRRGALPGAGYWTHQYGRPDNAATSGDELLAGPLRVAWWGRPGPRPMPDRGNRNPAPVAAGGRLYTQGNRILFGQDAYNGTILWSWQIPTLRRANVPRDGSNMVATRDGLLVAIGSWLIELDGETGERRRRLQVPTSTPERPYDWGYLAVEGDLLLGGGTRRGGHYLGDDGEWFEDFEEGSIAKVTSDYLFAVDRETGARKWVYGDSPIINSTISIAEGRAFFIESRNSAAREAEQGRLFRELLEEQHLVALDLDTGRVAWDLPFDFSRLQYVTYMAHAEGTLLVTGSDKDKGYHSYAFDTRTKELLWEHHIEAKKTHHSGHLMHPVIVGSRVYHNKHTYDLRTGKVLKLDPFDYHGCGTMAASARAIFHRFEYHGMLDLETGERTEFEGVRGGCWLGQIPSGGLLLAPESGAGCSCTHAIQTSMAFLPQSLLAAPAAEDTEGSTPR